MTVKAPAGQQGVPDALLAALVRLMAPLARLAVAQGVPHATLEELLKQSLVRAADQAHADLAPHRRVSRISTTTGIHRREATRLLQALRAGPAPAAPERRSRASEVLAHWLSSPEYRDRRGRPRSLPRQGDAPSFESLARAITRDVHPRGMLEEMLRLRMVTLDLRTDRVTLAADAATPRADAQRMLQFLADNVGDHLDGAVDNVLADGRRHFEQALFAEGLSPRSMDEVRREVSAQWQGLLRAMVPALEALVERDEGAVDATRRLRIGLYTFEQTLPDAPTPGDPAAKDPTP